MEWRQILYFIEVAKHEHVTEAAHRLHVAQSAVSRQLALLEAELGVALFTREGRNVKLTAIGRRFLRYAERAVAEIEQGKKKIEEYLDPERGTVNIGLATGVSAPSLPIALSQFREEHPAIGFQLIQGALADLLAAIDGGRLDIAFCAPVPTDHESVRGEIFYRERLVAVLPADHPLAEERVLSLSQLRTEPFLSFRRGLPLHDDVLKACEAAGFRPRFAFQGEDVNTIKALVAAGFGVALLPEDALSDLAPNLVKKAITEPDVYRTVGVIIPKHRDPAPSEAMLYAFLKAFYHRLTRFGE